MSNLTARRAYVPTLEAKIKSLTDSAEQKASILQERLSLAETQIIQERDALDRISSERLDERTQRQAAERDRDLLVHDCAKLQRQVAALEADKKGLVELTSRLDAAKEELKEEKEGLVSRLEEASRTFAELSADSKRVEAELAEVRANWRHADEVNRHGCMQLEAELEAALARAGKTQGELEEVAKAHDGVQEEKDKLRQRLEETQGELSRADGLKAEKNELKLTMLEKEAAAEEVTFSLVRAKASLARAVADKEQLEEEARATSDELQAAKKQAAQAQQRLVAFEEEKRMVVAGAAEAAKVAEAAMIAAKREADEARAEAKASEEKAKAMLDDAYAAADRSAERLRGVENRCTELQAALETAQEEKTRARLSRQESESTVRGLETELHASRSEYCELEQQLSQIHNLTSRQPSRQPSRSPSVAASRNETPSSLRMHQYTAGSPWAASPAATAQQQTHGLKGSPRSTQSYAQHQRLETHQEAYGYGAQSHGSHEPAPSLPVSRGMSPAAYRPPPSYQAALTLPPSVYEAPMQRPPMKGSPLASPTMSPMNSHPGHRDLQVGVPMPPYTPSSATVLH